MIGVIPLVTTLYGLLQTRPSRFTIHVQPVGFMRLPVAAGNDWWVVMPGCFVMTGCLFSHARPRPGISYDYAPPTNPRVATLIRTLGGKTERRALKQAIKVEPEYRLNRGFLIIL